MKLSIDHLLLLSRKYREHMGNGHTDPYLCEFSPSSRIYADLMRLNLLLGSHYTKLGDTHLITQKGIKYIESCMGLLTLLNKEI